MMLRFLNLLEPGKPVISITKTSMWLMTILMVALVVAQIVGYFKGLPPFSIEATIAAIAGHFATCALYAWRRWVQMHTGNPGLFPDDMVDAAKAAVASGEGEAVDAVSGQHLPWPGP
jgi:hypothetical protein